MKHEDDYGNALTGLSTSKDKSFFSIWTEAPKLSDELVSSVYEQDAIAARIVDRLVDDATREGFTIKGEDESFDFASIQSELEDLDAINAVADAWRWARLYGGALLVPVVNDGGKMDKPLNLDTARKLSSLQVLESPYVTPSAFNPGMGARAFRRPDFYDVTLPFSANKDRRIHRSRTIRFDGVRVAPTRMIQNSGWGPSILQRVWREVDQLGSVMAYARSIMHDLSVQTLKIDGFREKLAGSAQDKAEVRQMLESIRMAIDNLHVLALDSLDDYVEVSRTVGGLEALLEKFVDALVRATDMPRTILLGEQPSGLNANGDSEIRSWFDFVASQQRLILTPVITRVLEIIFATRRNRGEAVPEEWTVEFSPLWQPTQMERAETSLKSAQANSLYFTMGVKSSDEIRAELISSGELSPLESEREPTAPPEPEEGVPDVPDVPDDQEELEGLEGGELED